MDPGQAPWPLPYLRSGFISVVQSQAQPTRAMVLDGGTLQELCQHTATHMMLITKSLVFLQALAGDCPYVAKNGGAGHHHVHGWAAGSGLELTVLPD